MDNGSKMIEVYQLGTKVFLGSTSDDIPAKIIGIALYEGSTQYLVSWFDGKTRKQEWVYECEFNVVEKKNLKIGFTQNISTNLNPDPLGIPGEIIKKYNKLISVKELLEKIIDDATDDLNNPLKRIWPIRAEYGRKARELLNDKTT